MSTDLIMKPSCSGAQITRLIGELTVEEVPSAANSVTEGASSSSSETASTPSTGPVTEDEIRAVLLQEKPVTTQDLVNQFISRLKSREDKNTFAAALRRISRIEATNTGIYVVLSERARANQ